MVKNVHYVNNTGANLHTVWPVLQDAYRTGVIDDDYADLFKVEFLKSYNSDGTDRMIINAA